MPFTSIGLPQTVIDEIDTFVAANDMSGLYRSYNWGNDNYPNGFPDILRLEQKLTAHDQGTGITLDDVKEIAEWGSMRNVGRVAGPVLALPALTLHIVPGVPQPSLYADPAGPFVPLARVNGIGPTYQSKVLRFGMPAEYGAIDTRCVRVFGQGDPDVQRHNWLPLVAKNGKHGGRATGWSIPEKQRHWPDAFELWINILRRIAQVLPNNCPHPPGFIRSRLRTLGGAWACADVEMALFAYASRFA